MIELAKRKGFLPEFHYDSVNYTIKSTIIKIFGERITVSVINTAAINSNITDCFHAPRILRVLHFYTQYYTNHSNGSQSSNHKRGFSDGGRGWIPFSLFGSRARSHRFALGLSRKSRPRRKQHCCIRFSRLRIHSILSNKNGVIVKLRNT